MFNIVRFIGLTVSGAFGRLRDLLKTRDTTTFAAEFSIIILPNPMVWGAILESLCPSQKYSVPSQKCQVPICYVINISSTNTCIVLNLQISF